MKGSIVKKDGQITFQVAIFFILMYKMSKNVENRKIYARNTRQQNKFEFKMDGKIGTKYQNSPFYKGCK